VPTNTRHLPEGSWRGCTPPARGATTGASHQLLVLTAPLFFTPRRRLLQDIMMDTESRLFGGEHGDVVFPPDLVGAFMAPHNSGHSSGTLTADFWVQVSESRAGLAPVLCRASPSGHTP
jgi:hypothetical protein